LIEVFLKRIKHNLAFDNPNTGAIFFLSFFESLNFITVLKLFKLTKEHSNIYLVLVIWGILFIINYFTLFRTKKYKVIHKEFDRYTPNERKLAKTIGISYIFLTLLFLSLTWK